MYKHNRDDGKSLVSSGLQINDSDDFTDLNDTVPKSTRFQALSLLGQGTYGVVWRGFDRILSKDVAIKQFKKLSCEKWGFSVFALREISLLKSLHHPNLATILDVVYDSNLSSKSLLLILNLEDTGFKTSPNLFLIYTGNLDLEKWIASKRNTCVEIADCKSFVLQILLGCNYLHDKRIMHRDIKPDNILMSRSGHLKIADLGMARVCHSENPGQYSSQVQALWYRAPELLLGSTHYSPAIDIWSIGCIMGELLNDGKLLFFSKDGTAVDQIHQIFQVLGTPVRPTDLVGVADMHHITGATNPQNIAPTRSRQRWYRDSFPKWPPRDLHTMLPVHSAHPAAISLLKRMLALEPAQRISADGALRSPFFRIP